jgi:diguanylate cyclase (GGDEF)-like protein
VGPGDRPSFEFVSEVDGLLHLGSYRRVPDLPLLVMVGQAKADILAGWRRTVAMHVAGLAILIVLILYLAGSLLRRVEAVERTQAALQHSNARLAESEARMARANRWLEMAEELAQVGHWVLSLQGEPRLVWSDEVYRIYGVDKAGFVPDIDTAAAVFNAEDRAALAEAIARAGRGETIEVALRLTGPDGSTRHILSRVGPQLGDDGVLVAVFGVVIDVTAQKRSETALVAARATAEDANLSLEQANRALEALAMQDALTGLSNRRHFDLALDGEFRRAMRMKTSLALILIDVDQFKQFNDMYGHQAGDACLRAIAGILPRFLKRPGDMAARYGGEELAVLLPGNTESGAKDLAERIADAVRDLGLVHAGSQHGMVTISAGVQAFVPVHDLDSTGELVEHADLALYAAKRAGRDRVFAYSELGRKTASGPA